MELDVAHERERRLLDVVLRTNKVDRVDIASDEESKPARTRSMSFKEAAQRVREFEKATRLNPVGDEHAGKIEEAIQSDAGNSSRLEKSGQGRAV